MRSSSLGDEEIRLKNDILVWLRGKMNRSGDAKPIQRTIAVAFTLVSVICMCVLGVTLYGWFSEQLKAGTVRNSQQLLNQTTDNLDDYLRSMRRISDAMYYSVIKDKDLDSDSLDAEMSLIYEINKDDLVNIACFTKDGELVSAAPIDTQKANVDVKEQMWFQRAADEVENLHFSTPHVMNIFDDTTHYYHWVISLSRAVELTDNGSSSLGILLVDMKFSSIEQMLDKVNAGKTDEYIYLMDDSGAIIYHPKQQLIFSGLYEENNQDIAELEDGIHENVYKGERRQVQIKTVSYTGWKLVYVSSLTNFQFGSPETKYFMVMFVAMASLMIFLLNQMVSAQIAKPLQKLNQSVQDWEAGNMTPQIYIGGSEEVEHLGKTLQRTVEQLRRLMDEMVIRQEEKRKSELDALQSQINPHFLYNTLDSIVWMIEGEKYDEAVFMITQLASLFRISLSKGKTIISVEDELKHVKNYMNIQKVRYKNKFSVEYEIDESILNYCTVKLIIQPILENAIYYGVEYMDGDGEIKIIGYKKDNDIYIEVTDNGLGMTRDVVENLLKENNRVRKRGSGVGLINVHNRLKLRFGENYGLEIESEPDEGTTVRIHLPSIPYSIETAEELESSKGILG